MPDPGDIIATTKAGAVRGLRRLADPLLSWCPVLDGAIVEHHARAALRTAGSWIDALVVGSTVHELNMVVLGLPGVASDATYTAGLSAFGLEDRGIDWYRERAAGRSAADALSQAFTDRTIRIPASEIADRAATDGLSTYLYQFEWESPAMGGAVQAGHCVDLPFWFDNLDAEHVDVTLGSSPPRELAETMNGALCEVAEHGDPGWAAYDTVERSTRMLGLDPRTERDPIELIRTVWSVGPAPPRAVMRARTS